LIDKKVKFKYSSDPIFTGAGCHIDHYLSLSIRAAQKFDMERFNLEKLNDVAVEGQYQVKISNRSAALENLKLM
jgi:hypothetical protein